MREPDAQALDIIHKGAEDVIAVTEDQIADGLRLLFDTTHNVAEGAGAVAIAGALQDKDKNGGKSIGIVLSGGNIDQDRFKNILNGGNAP